MTHPDTPPAPEPYGDAVRSLLTGELLAELATAEAAYRTALAEALAARTRAEEHIRHHYLGRPFEALEFELHREHSELVRYHAGRFARRIRWVLEAWKDAPEG